MGIYFRTQSFGKESDTVDVDLGTGKLFSAQPALQGFSFSFSDYDHCIREIKPALSHVNTYFDNQSHTTHLTYQYDALMMDNDKPLHKAIATIDVLELVEIDQ